MRYTKFDPDLNRFVVPCLYKADGERITFYVKEEPAERAEYQNLRGERISITRTPPLTVVWGEVIDRLAELENEKDELFDVAEKALKGIQEAKTLYEKDIANAKVEAVKEFVNELMGNLFRIPQHHFTLAEVKYYIDRLTDKFTS